MEAVLFVDDDEDLREVMSDILHTFSVRRVVTAGSLQEVIAQRDASLACDLAILDINLGVGQPTGVNVYEWLQGEGFAGGVIFLTGHAAADPRVQQAASVTGSVIASKPISIAVVRELLGGTRHAI